ALVTKSLLFANILVFVAGLYLAMQANVPANLWLAGSGNEPWQNRAIAEVEHRIGAVSPPDLIEGKWWRLLTCCFVHHGLLPPALKMWGVYALGRFLEPLWGHGRYLALYLIAGWGASCVALSIKPIQLVGASGALCGMVAVAAVWVLLNRAYLPGQVVSSLLRNLMINGVLIVFISLMPNISAAAHFGGAAVGAVAAVCMHYQRYGRRGWRWLGLAGTLAVPLLCAAVLANRMHADSRWQAIAEQGRQRKEVEEIRRFEAEYLQRTSRVLRAAETFYQEEAAPLLNQHPT